MNPEIIAKPAFQVIGLKIRAPAKSPEIAQLWDKFVPRIGEFGHSPEPHVSYGLMDHFDAGAMDYMAGNPVEATAPLLPGMERWDVPANTYAVFAATLPTIGPVFDAIFSQWLPSSGYIQAAGTYFERYGADFSPQHPQLQIYIPIKRKN